LVTKPTINNSPVLEKETTVIVDETTQPVTVANFEAGFNSFLLKLQAENKMSFVSILNASVWNLTNENSVDIRFPNQLAFETFEDEKLNIIPFMRKFLNNNKFDFTTQIDVVIRTSKPYSNKEKFDAMNEKNPMVNELKQLLMLDFE